MVGSFEDGCIIQVAYENTQNVHGVSCLSSEPVSHLERVVGELRERVDAELGFVEDSQDRLEPLVSSLVILNRVINKTSGRHDDFSESRVGFLFPTVLRKIIFSYNHQNKSSVNIS